MSMNISSNNQKVNITNHLSSLIISGSYNNVIIANEVTSVNVSGSYNKILIKGEITSFVISGSYNKINAVDPNCDFTHINISGNENSINLNQNCSNVSKNVSGNNNKFMIDGKEMNNNSGNKRNFNVIRNHHNDNYDVQCFYYSNVGNWMDSLNFNQNNNMPFDFNNLMDNLNNFQFYIDLNNNNNNMSNSNNSGYSNNSNARVNNSNNARDRNDMSNSSFGNNNNNRNEANNANNAGANNISNMNDVTNSINKSINFKNLSDFEKKKLQLILEMDEYQYKHIQKYENREEKECAICIEEFKGIDILKAFYKCDHIFHKKCLLDWLKKHNDCPYCKHDLTEDIKTMK